MPTTTPVVPNWVVTEDVPDLGTRWFYPLPPADLPRHPTTRWVGTDGAEVQELAGYLVSTQPLTEVTAEWAARRIIGYRRRPNIRNDSDAGLATRTLADAMPDYFPEQLTVDEWDSRCECERAGVNVCVWHQVRADAYEPMREDETHTRVFDLSDYRELPSNPDPDPDVPWTLDTRALVDFYPHRAHHLLPGSFPFPTELFETTLRAKLAELGLSCASVHVWTHSHEASVSADLLFDEVLPYTVSAGRSRQIKDANAERRRAATVGTSWRSKVTLPRVVRGDDKGDALHNLAMHFERLLALLVPPHTEVCSNCRGRGYTR